MADVTPAPKELEGQANLHYDANCDITKRESCKKFIDSISGRLDGLVNCAGICPVEGKMAPDELFARIMAINVTGSWNMGTEAIQKMTQQKGSSTTGILPASERTLGAGVIVNIASGASLRGIAGLGAYCTSKHAVMGMTRSWAKEWPTLRVNAVAPGEFRAPVPAAKRLTKSFRCDRYATIKRRDKQHWQHGGPEEALFRAVVKDPTGEDGIRHRYCGCYSLCSVRFGQFHDGTSDSHKRRLGLNSFDD